MKIADEYIPGGNTQQIGNFSAILRPRPELELRGFFQYESWLEPVLAPTRQRDVTASVQFTWWPGLGGQAALRMESALGGVVAQDSRQRRTNIFYIAPPTLPALRGSEMVRSPM